MAAIPQLGLLDETQANLTTAANGRTYTGPWIRTEGVTKVACRWVSTGGATITVTVEESLDGATADVSTSAGAAGASGPAAPTVVQVAAPWIRLKAVGSVTDTATHRAAMMAV